MTSIQKFLTGLWGIVHGTVGTIWGLAGCFLAFPIDSAPGTKELGGRLSVYPFGLYHACNLAHGYIVQLFSPQKK